MRLRVFANPAGNLLVEISHPSLKASVRWFLPMLPETSPAVRAIERSRLVTVRLQGVPYEILYLHIRVIGSPLPQLQQVGHLEAEHSINVLNHIQDLLAWD